MYLSQADQLLLDALANLPDPAWCEGACDVAAPIELTLPDGSSRALDAPDLAAWLATNAEPAPYGDATGTRIDPEVRDTRRLRARGAIRIASFDPAMMLGEIERELRTDCRLVAELLDVLVYQAGSRFLPHKDTPRHDDQLGTLVVELPHAHRGGGLRIDVDGAYTATIDWSSEHATHDRVRWVAMFGDVDHEITPVVDGLRLTAVYTLRYRADARLPPADRERFDAIVDAAIGLHDEYRYNPQHLAIPCVRMIVAPREAPPDVAMLRGADRLIAAALERAGLAVRIVECLAVTHDPAKPIGEVMEEARSYRRLVAVRRSIPDDVMRVANALSWHPEPESSYDHVIAAVAPYVDTEETIPADITWLVRPHVRLDCREMAFSQTGYFGNEYSDAFVYRFAFLLVEVPGADV